MRAQLQRLADATTLPSVTLQVLPFGAGAHPGMDGPFTIIGFPDRADRDVVYIENVTSDAYIEDVDATRRYGSIFDHLLATAQPGRLGRAVRQGGQGAVRAGTSDCEWRSALDLSGATWRKSTSSHSNGCVEVAFLDGEVAVRDSKDRSGPVLRFTPFEWEAFVSALRDGGCAE
jgi:hypothetical protein